MFNETLEPQERNQITSHFSELEALIQSLETVNQLSKNEAKMIRDYIESISEEIRLQYSFQKTNETLDIIRATIKSIIPNVDSPLYVTMLNYLGVDQHVSKAFQNNFSLYQDEKYNASLRLKEDNNKFIYHFAAFASEIQQSLKKIFRIQVEHIRRTESDQTIFGMKLFNLLLDFHDNCQQLPQLSQTYEFIKTQFQKFATELNTNDQVRKRIDETLLSYLYPENLNLNDFSFLTELEKQPNIIKTIVEDFIHDDIKKSQDELEKQRATLESIYMKLTPNTKVQALVLKTIMNEFKNDLSALKKISSEDHSTQQTRITQAEKTLEKQHEKEQALMREQRLLHFENLLNKQEQPPKTSKTDATGRVFTAETTKLIGPPASRKKP